MATSTPNDWCEKLGVSPPDLAALAARKDIGTRDLMIAALLEQGSRMTIDAIAGRLAALGGRGTKEQLLVSIAKAWGGGEPLFRDADGRFGLELGSPEFRWYRLHLYPAPEREAKAPAPLSPPPTERLSKDELREGLKNAYLGNLSGPRLYAAVLDATQRPMHRAEIEAFLAPLLPDRRPLTDQDLKYWRRPLVARDDVGRLFLLDAPDQLLKMRAQIRAICRRTRKDSARDVDIEAFRRVRAERDRVQEVEAQIKRRAVIHGLVIRGEVAALTILDVAGRRLETLVGDEVDQAQERVRGYDVLVGLDARALLDTLEIDTGSARCLDLRSAPKSRRLNRSGRTLKISPEMLIRGSVNLSRALGDRKKMAGYARDGKRTRLVRRMESDAKALYAWYAYGVLHRGVRLRWGFLDEMLPVSWGEQGDEPVRGILGATKAGRTVEVVLQTAPGWEDPWARARKVLSYEVLAWHVLVDDVHGPRYAALEDVVAARIR